jgi:hypothetical protein
VLNKPRQPVTNPPVAIGAPPNIPGATLQEKIDNYAAVLNQYMEKALPTPVVAGRADKDIAVDNPFLPVKSDLKIFFDKNLNYEFRNTPIDVYLSTDRDTKLQGVVNPVALVAELKNMQRLFNITPRYAEMRSLALSGFDGESGRTQVRRKILDGVRRLDKGCRSLPQSKANTRHCSQHLSAKCCRFQLAGTICHSQRKYEISGRETRGCGRP